MASVSSLDQDMKRLRLDRYTPAAAQEVRAWIEEILNEKLPPGDLLDVLRDGIALCKLANLAIAPQAIKYNTQDTPFKNMENIDRFLKVSRDTPINLEEYNRFQTVDLYDKKDPAQVLQCIAAFSRKANEINPRAFHRVLGPKRSSSPVRKTGSSPGPAYGSNYGSPKSTTSSGQVKSLNLQSTPSLDPPATTRFGPSGGGQGVSSWSKKSDESNTAPAWNIHQYGYMGGASQGNQGVSFGARRQITSPPVSVPSREANVKQRYQGVTEVDAFKPDHEAESLKARQEQEAQDEALRQRHMQERQEAEDRAREEEKRRWEEETRRIQMEEETRRIQMEEETRRKQIEEDGRRRQVEEDTRRRQMEEESERSRNHGLGSHTWDQPTAYTSAQIAQQTQDQTIQQSEAARIRELEQQLAEAKARERAYQGAQTRGSMRPTTPPREVQTMDMDEPGVSREHNDPDEERNFLQKEWKQTQSIPARTLPSPTRSRPSPFARPAQTTPLSAPRAEQQPAMPASASAEVPQSSNDPSRFSQPEAPHATRTDQFLATNPAPIASRPTTHFPSEMGLTSESERAAEDARRVQSQKQTKAGGWASKSLLEREMERERERQRQWEEEQIAKQSQYGLPSQKPLGPRTMGR